MQSQVNNEIQHETVIDKFDIEFDATSKINIGITNFYKERLK